MFFFLVGGVEQQVSQVLKKGAGKCIACGSTKADLVEYEKVLKLFFVPVWRWPGKEPIMRCNNCSLFFPPSISSSSSSSSTASRRLPHSFRCHYCARIVDPEYRFCPYCASAL